LHLRAGREADDMKRPEIDFHGRTILITGAATGMAALPHLRLLQRVMRVDVTGVFLCLKYELAHMTKVGRGAIVNTASVAGIRADPGMAPYVAAKHAVVGLTKAAAIDYATQGFRINAIAPGLVRTPMTERWLNDSEMRDRVLADPPIGRAAEPEDIAGLVLFLTSDLANMITGAVYPIDGARTAH
jgi:NAD(P)-dependent dehydrogenase (short-subunit alcohol dehydrogenase family)